MYIVICSNFKNSDFYSRYSIHNWLTNKNLSSKHIPKRNMGFPGGSAGKESACNVGELGLIPGLGRSPGEGKCYPLQYSGLENSMDCMSWGHKELDTIEPLSLSLSFHIHLTIDILCVSFLIY